MVADPNVVVAKLFGLDRGAAYRIGAAGPAKLRQMNSVFHCAYALPDFAQRGH